MTKWIGWLVAGVIAFTYFWFNQGTVEVTRIIDGDTVEVSDGRRIRYIGIDSQEKGDCYATAAAKLNEELVLGKKVRLELDTKEMGYYGRTLAYVWVDGELINETLLQKGAGEFLSDPVNIKYQDRLIKAANEGHEQRAGLWSECAQEKEAGCNIKGNLDKDDNRYYHLPHFRHYNQIIMNLDHGDRWFCSEEGAQKAGFTRARE